MIDELLPGVVNLLFLSPRLHLQKNKPNRGSRCHKL